MHVLLHPLYNVIYPSSSGSASYSLPIKRPSGASKALTPFEFRDGDSVA